LPKVFLIEVKIANIPHASFIPELIFDLSIHLISLFISKENPALNIS